MAKMEMEMVSNVKINAFKNKKRMRASVVKAIHNRKMESSINHGLVIKIDVPEHQRAWIEQWCKAAGGQL